eukprot:237120_1
MSSISSIPFENTSVPSRNRFRWPKVSQTWIVYQDGNTDQYTITFKGKNKKKNALFTDIYPFVTEYCTVYSSEQTLTDITTFKDQDIQDEDLDASASQRFGQNKRLHEQNKRTHNKLYRDIVKCLRKQSSTKSKRESSKKSKCKSSRKSKQSSTHAPTRSLQSTQIPQSTPRTQIQQSTSSNSMQTRSHSMNTRSLSRRLPFESDNKEEDGNTVLNVSPNKTTLSLKVRDIAALLGPNYNTTHPTLNIIDDFGRTIQLQSGITNKEQILSTVSSAITTQLHSRITEDELKQLYGLTVVERVEAAVVPAVEAVVVQEVEAVVVQEVEAVVVQ